MKKLIAKLAENYAKYGATCNMFIFHQPRAPKSLIK